MKRTCLVQRVFFKSVNIMQRVNALTLLLNDRKDIVGRNQKSGTSLVISLVSLERILRTEDC